MHTLRERDTHTVITFASIFRAICSCWFYGASVSKWHPNSKDAEHKQPLLNAKLCVCTCALIGNRTALNKRLRLRQSIALDFCSCFNFLWHRERFFNIKRNANSLRKNAFKYLKQKIIETIHCVSNSVL